VIDFHCHLDLYPDPHRIARECAERGLHVLSVTTTPSAWNGTAALSTAAPTIRTALGLHPQLAHERKNELAMFEHLLPQNQYVGEVGLDGSPEFKHHWPDQILVFTRILNACSAAGGRILSVHSRRAATTVLDMLKQRPGIGTPILHWFSGTPRELSRAIALGCWFSVGPAMLAGEKGRALAARIPRDRLLTETDGPFAQIEGRSALPWEVDQAAAGLGALWNESASAVNQQLQANLQRLESVPLPSGKAISS
jgi:TatD DNase family protein